MIWAAYETPEDNGAKIETIKLLIGKGAHLDANIDGYTALWQACESGHGEVVKLLLDAGADPDLKAYPDDIATTPLMEVRNYLVTVCYEDFE